MHNFIHKNFFRPVKGIALIVTLMFGNLALAQQAAPKSVLPEPRQLEGPQELKPHLGARVGLATPSADYKGAIEYGLEFGIQPFIPFSVGLELTRFTGNDERSAAPNLDRTNFLVRGSYNFGGDIAIIKNSWVGINAGPVFDRVGDTTYTRLGTGILAGADFPLSESGTSSQSFTLGATASYLLVTDTDADIFALNGAVKYWF